MRATANPSASVGLKVTSTGSPARQRRHQAGSVVRFHADDFGLRLSRLDHGGDTREQAAAADRYNDSVDVGRLIENFERHRALARDHVEIVERMHEREALGCGELFGPGARFTEVGAVQYYGRAQHPAVGDLDQRRKFRHHLTGIPSRPP
jgi:hypothetical protein